MDRTRRVQKTALKTSKGGVFSEPAFFLGTFQARPTRAHTCPGITWRLCGGLGASVARDLRALRLWQSSRQWHAVPWSCIDAAPGCRALRRSSNNILTAWPGRVAQAPRAGRSRTPWSCSPHIGTFVEKRPVGGSARARRRSELANVIAETDVTRARVVRGSLPSAICQLPAPARSS